MKVSTVSQMRAMDQAAIDTYGISEELLMENAGHAAFAVLNSLLPMANNCFALFCGLGNNGGDGFVVARNIYSLGGRAKVYILGDPQNFSGAAALNLSILRRLPVEIRVLASANGIDRELTECSGVIDAIFGTGLSREVSGLHREIIEAINACSKPVLSLDIPSGVQGDTGRILGCAVQADHTVTFGLPKIGNLLYPGHEQCGTLHVNHLSFPIDLYRSESLSLAINTPANLPQRAANGHKGSFGQTLFIGGAAGYLGAPSFAALSFLRAGGGYSRLATPSSITPFISMQASEIVFLPQKETTGGSISLANRDSLLQVTASQDMVVLGPGLSLDGESQQLARELTAEIKKPLLIDGDGITALCGNLHILRQRQAPTVLTPHLGEMARLTGTSIAEIDADKIGILQKTAADLGAIIVLKGAHSLIGLPDGKVFINLSGNSGMATAGSGDILTGTIAALHCLGLPLSEAVCQGVFLHGLAGDLAARDKGEDGIIARDILAHLPLATRKMRIGLPPELAKRYAGPSPA